MTGLVGTESLAQRRPLGRTLITWLTTVVLSLCISKMGLAPWGYGEVQRSQRVGITGGHRLGGQWVRGTEDCEKTSMVASTGRL